MTFRMIAILAAISVAVFALADALYFGALDTPCRLIYSGIARISLLALVAAASGLAANRFGWWREYVGRAWTLFFAAYSLLTIGEAFRRFTESGAIGEVCVIAANVALVGAYWLTARSFKAAGLDFGGSRAQTIVATSLALVIALAICHDALLSNVNALFAGDVSVSRFISPLADVITFALVAPLLLTAFALRGGQQFWMFALLTTGTVGWMINQGIDAILELAGGASDAVVRSGRMTGFAMACIFIASAALTQWLAAQRTTRGVAHV
jgi:hypothetical protein